MSSKGISRPKPTCSRRKSGEFHNVSFQECTKRHGTSRRKVDKNDRDDGT